jgi:hypothetical protein
MRHGMSAVIGLSFISDIWGHRAMFRFVLRITGTGRTEKSTAGRPTVARCPFPVPRFCLAVAHAALPRGEFADDFLDEVFDGDDADGPAFRVADYGRGCAKQGVNGTSR